MKHRNIVRTLAAAGVALAISGMVLSNSAGKLRLRAKHEGRMEISRIMPSSEGLTGRAKERAIALEEGRIEKALPVLPRLPLEKLNAAYNDSMQIVYIRKNGDTAFSYDISLVGKSSHPLARMAKEALGTVLALPCEERCEGQPGRRQTVPYVSWAAFVLGNVRCLVFDERHQPDSTVWARHPDVVANPLVWATKDGLAFAGIMVHEAGHNYSATLGIDPRFTMQNERLAASFFYAYLRAAEIYLPDSALKLLGSHRRQEAMYVLSKASQESIVDELATSLADEKAKPWKRMESASSWMMAAGAVAAMLALLEKYGLVLSRMLGKKEEE